MTVYARKVITKKWNKQLIKYNSILKPGGENELSKRDIVNFSTCKTKFFILSNFFIQVEHYTYKYNNSLDNFETTRVCRIFFLMKTV